MSAATGDVRTRTGEVLRPKKPRGRTVGTVIVGLGIAFILVYCLAPFYWMIVSALRRPSEGRSTELIPNPISVENFAAVFDPSNHFARALLNSLIVAGGTTLLVLVLGVFGAYALARLDFRGKVAVMFLIVATSMFPVVTLVVPLLKLFSGGYDWFPVNWINTYQAMILPTISFALSVGSPIGSLSMSIRPPVASTSSLRQFKCPPAPWSWIEMIGLTPSSEMARIAL